MRFYMNNRMKIRKLVREYCMKEKVRSVNSDLAHSIVWKHMGTRAPCSTSVFAHLRGAKDFQYDDIKKEHSFLGQFDEDEPRGMD